MIGHIHTLVPFFTNATWQSSILIAVVFICTRLLKNRPAVIRQTLWTIALFGSLIVPLLNFGLNGIGGRGISLLEVTQSVSLPSTHESANQHLKKLTDGETGESCNDAIGNPHHISRFTPYVILSNLLISFWGVGICVTILRLISGWLSLGRIRRASVTETNQSVRQMLTTLTNQMGVREAVEARVSTAILIPCVLGIHKPIILLPSDLFSHLQPSELRAVLAHELAHIRRKDYLVHCCQRIIQAVCWFHPLIHFAARQARRECERICDDWVLRVTGKQVNCAKGLYKLAEVSGRFPRLQPVLLLFRRKSDLFKQIESILNGTAFQHASLSLKGRCGLGLLEIGLICVAGTTRILEIMPLHTPDLQVHRQPVSRKTD